MCQIYGKIGISLWIFFFFNVVHLNLTVCFSERTGFILGLGYQKFDTVWILIAKYFKVYQWLNWDCKQLWWKMDGRFLVLYPFNHLNVFLVYAKWIACYWLDTKFMLSSLMAWASAEGQRSWVKPAESDKLSLGLWKWETECMGDSASTLQMCASFQVFLVCVVLSLRFFWQKKSEKVTV